MKNFQRTHGQKGQAMVEMVVCMVVLFLLLAGILQFAVLFTSRVQFEHACGEAAREYCAKLVDQDSLGPTIYKNLGYFQKYFDEQSLRITIQEPQSTGAKALENARSAIHFIPFLINYEGCEWAVNADCRPPFFSKILFPNGVRFHTVMQVYRYSR